MVRLADKLKNTSWSEHPEQLSSCLSVWALYSSDIFMFSFSQVFSSTSDTATKVHKLFHLPLFMSEGKKDVKKDFSELASFLLFIAILNP